MAERPLTRMFLIMDQIRTASSTQQIVLLALASYVNDERGDDLCWPSISVLAEKCVCSNRTITRTIRELEQQGFIRVSRHRKGKRNDSNRYKLNLDPALNAPLENRPRFNYYLPENYDDDTVSPLTETLCHGDDVGTVQYDNAHHDTVSPLTETLCHGDDVGTVQYDKTHHDTVSPLTMTLCHVPSDKMSPLTMTQCLGESVIESSIESTSESYMSHEHDFEDELTDEDFEKFMAEWPNIKNLTALETDMARRAWSQLADDERDLSKIIDAIRKMTQAKTKTQIQFNRWPSPERWLSSKSWLPIPTSTTHEKQLSGLFKIEGIQS